MLNNVSMYRLNDSGSYESLSRHKGEAKAVRLPAPWIMGSECLSTAKNAPQCRPNLKSNIRDPFLIVLGAFSVFGQARRGLHKLGLPLVAAQMRHGRNE